MLFPGCERHLDEYLETVKCMRLQNNFRSKRLERDCQGADVDDLRSYVLAATTKDSINARWDRLWYSSQYHLSLPRQYLSRLPRRSRVESSYLVLRPSSLTDIIYHFTKNIYLFLQLTTGETLI